MHDIWLPPSYQFRAVKEAREAASDYDPNLDFGFNNSTQQWVVFIKQGTMPISTKGDHPILGFKDIPGREEVQRRLYQSDAFRRGMEIMDDLQRHNDSREKDYSDIDGQVAETFEWAFRKKGSEKAPIKVYMPGDKS